MSFGTAVALLVGLLVAAPIVAHLLRRGKTKSQEFPPAHLVPLAVVTSKQKSRLEDRLLLLMRSLTVLALAVLGATPFVSCERLSVDRQAGASVAMAIVIDDSQSMRATVDNAARIDQALEGASQLLGSARQGDVVALVLAGKPARLLLSPTPELDAATEALGTVQPSDRPTDLEEAVALARSSLKELPHVDKRVILLSDLAAERLPDGEPKIWTPLPALQARADNCGIASAQKTPRDVNVTVGCNAKEASAGRQVSLFLTGDSAEPLVSLPLRASEGEQSLRLRHASLGMELHVVLDGPSDAIAEDDRASVAAEAGELAIAVVADPTKSSAVTGGPTLLEQALSAIDPKLQLKPLGSLPVAAEDLGAYAAVVVDDPPGLSPEARAALNEWLESGGVALGLLGPSAASAQLAASAEPFARKGALWEETRESLGIDPESLSWLGRESSSLRDVNARGRVRLDAADLPETTIAAKWTDGAPFMFRRNLGRGLVLTVGLPASLDHSDFSLRPGYLALLQETLQQARSRTGPKRSIAGTTWLFPTDSQLSVNGPDGPLRPQAAREQSQMRRVTPVVAGKYQVELDNKTESRVVVLDVEELTQRPLGVESSENSAAAGAGENEVDASPEWALLVLGLLALELLMRLFGESLSRRLRRA